ncbi:DUF116 domain-containing protein [Desulfosoma caldarium]|uniref:DUF116 domain-containing protein n=1 Tax=Desulfosoma caldarium TaxID=610254 RepID=A0A3N1UHI6_9BACT|nr:DUF116 domain-containing protein [Desulfosoma caldarium]ROQ90722.1 hypothetical protein EDC27_2612 [Desulfosoma caldarium]
MHSFWSEKSLILVLLMVACVLLVAVLGLLFVVPYWGFAGIHPMLPQVAGIVFALILAGLLAGFGLLMAAIFLGRDVPFSAWLRSLSAKGLLPLLIAVGRLVGVSKKAVQHAFVGVNNELVLASVRSRKKPRRVLLLMPHCIQFSQCPVRITFQVDNCKRCGKCPIADLLRIKERYGVDLAVATGGTIARRIVVETRPDLILAVACERDLVSGIQDTLPLPVYGIFNERPNGPCVDTRVPLDEVRAVLASLLEKA